MQSKQIYHYRVPEFLFNYNIIWWYLDREMLFRLFLVTSIEAPSSMEYKGPYLNIKLLQANFYLRYSSSYSLNFM